MVFNTALRNTREIASQLSLSFFCTLDSRLSSAGASRILVHALHATRLGRTNFPMRWTFFRDCVTFVNFARSIGLKTLCSSVVSMKTSAARRPGAFLTNCHAYSTLPLNFSHFSLRLDCSSVWWCIQAHFLQNSWEDGVVQLPFRPALRLRLFSNGLLAPSFLSNLSSNYFPSGVSLKPETSWPYNSLNTLLLEERQNSSRWSLQESEIRTENWETVWGF